MDDATRGEVYVQVVQEQHLRIRIAFLEGRLATLKKELHELNRPKHIDAKQIIADLEARES